MGGASKKKRVLIHLLLQALYVCTQQYLLMLGGVVWKEFVLVRWACHPKATNKKQNILTGA